jgi:hypothetical protein
VADEITVAVSLSAYKSSIMSEALGRSVDGETFTMTGNYVSHGVALIATSVTAIPLGQVTAPHWAFFRNHDASNFLKIRNGSSGADLLKLLAGEFFCGPLYDSAVPYAIADTASCLLEYLILTL